MKRFFPLILLSLTLPLFFSNLGSYSLVDFDEAWFAEIARNILRFRNPFTLIFNGQAFLDHPPVGLNLMALSFLVFGVNEFSARLSSALLGFGSVIVTYLIGKTIFNKFVGLSAALMLTSSVWFVFRAREADLDSPFLFFFLLSIFCAAKVRSNPNWLYALGFVFALTLQVKSGIGLSALPAITFLIFLARSQITRRQLFFSATIFGATLAFWLVPGWLVHGPNSLFHQLAIGLRVGSHTASSNNTLTYLHSGIGKWYYPVLLSLPLSIFLIRRRPELLALLASTLLLLAGFLTNNKTEIWHLLPLYPLLFLIFSAVVFWFLPPTRPVRTICTTAILLVAVYQIFNFRASVRLTDSGLSDLAKTARAAKDSSLPLYLDSQDFLPSAVFYSAHRVFWTKVTLPLNSAHLLITQNNLTPGIFLSQNGPWRLVMLE